MKIAMGKAFTKGLVIGTGAKDAADRAWVLPGIAQISSEAAGMYTPSAVSEKVSNVAIFVTAPARYNIIPHLR
jgi:hypothetical protein